VKALTLSVRSVTGTFISSLLMMWSVLIVIKWLESIIS